MNGLKLLAFAAVAGLMFAATPPNAQAQVAVEVGVAPDCPYGYFDYAPYSCVPDGYYGTEWFNGGVFIGAGPWFHGPHGFFGHVDNRFDPHHGYVGPLPARNDHAFAHFQGNEARDGQGHVGNAGHEPTNEHSAGFSGRGSPGGHGHR